MIMKKVKIGLLPLYIELYDTALPALRKSVEGFAAEIAEKLKKEDLEVMPAPVCCVKDEFEKAVKSFENNGVDVIVTLHVAYSPSLESASVLCSTDLPVIVMDTTPDYVFDENSGADAVLHNHGIHGVQDLCNLLKRGGKAFEIFAGHYAESDICKKVADTARVLCAAKSLKNAKVGIIGKRFEGMGDFLADTAALNKLGIQIITANEKELEACAALVTEAEIKAEYQRDKAFCDMNGITFDDYAKTERVALTVRKWITDKNLDAFTMNFQSAGEMKGFETMPFAEAGKQMSNGTGYAGEGDALTAALVGSFTKYFKEVSFAEMFCPDWKGENVYLSHMGEMNLNIMENPHMILKDFPYAVAFNPTCIMGNMKAGKACYVNIAPNNEGYFDLILADGNMQQISDRKTAFYNSINGWFKPECRLEEFLEKFSRFGGTHHGMVVYGVGANVIAAYARALDMRCYII